jgi:hypothetical protein
VNALIYIACCMGISFFVGLIMGMRVSPLATVPNGYVAGLDYAEQERRLLAHKYTELMRMVRAKEGTL